MPRNHKLANALKRRTVNSTVSEGGKVLITFNDGSVLPIRSETPTSTLSGSVAAVFEATELQINFDNGSSQTFVLADPAASVSLRDRNGAVEYLG